MSLAQSLKKIYYKLRGFKTFNIVKECEDNSLCYINGKAYKLLSNYRNRCKLITFVLSDDTKHKGYIKREVIEDVLDGKLTYAIKFFIGNYYETNIEEEEIDPENIKLIYYDDWNFFFGKLASKCYNLSDLDYSLYIVTP